MIRPVTYQGVANFNANLYALEVRSRHIDQSKADGFYKGYGSELAATLVGSQITIGTGAFIVQGRMNEVVTPETLDVTIVNGNVGYIVARIETYHPSDENNCTFAVRTGLNFASVVITQENTYSTDSDTVNKVYELPLYSFTMASDSIQELTKLITVVDDYQTVKELVDGAVNTANSAKTAADAATTTANQAASDVADAIQEAEAATTAATNAVATAQTAVNTANGAVQTVEEEHTEMTAEIEALAQQIGDKQGTTVTINGTAQATIELGTIDCGGA
jgi:hypothetical protein